MTDFYQSIHKQSLFKYVRPKIVLTFRMQFQQCLHMMQHVAYVCTCCCMQKLQFKTINTVLALTLNQAEHFLRVWSKTLCLYLQFILVCGHQHCINFRMLLRELIDFFQMFSSRSVERTLRIASFEFRYPCPRKSSLIDVTLVSVYKSGSLSGQFGYSLVQTWVSSVLPNGFTD